MKNIKELYCPGLLTLLVVLFLASSPTFLVAQDSTRHFQAALELVKATDVKEALRGGLKMVRGYGKLPPGDSTVQQFDRSYDALFDEPAVYNELASVYVSTYDEKTIEGALKWTSSKAFKVEGEKKEMIDQLVSAPADHSSLPEGVDTSGTHYKTALEVARIETRSEKSAMSGMPGGGKKDDAPDLEKENKLARIYTGQFDEATLKEKLEWVKSDAYKAYTKNLPSIQMKCVMIVIGKLQ